MRRWAKRIAAFLLTAALMLTSAGAEAALTVNEREFTCAQCDAWMWLVKQSYRDMVDYYERTLGIDYWSLTYTNGQSVWDSVKADAFKQLIMMQVYGEIASREGLRLNRNEAELCARDAEALPENASFDKSDLEEMLRLRLLAGKAYSYCLSFQEIDEESVIASVEKDIYIAYEAEYLYVPYYVYSTGAASREGCIKTLKALKNFEGAYEDAARLNAFLVSGKMTLCPADCACDAQLLATAQTLRVGEASEPVTTDYGLFMIRLLDDSDSSLYDAEVEKRLSEARKRAYRSEYNRLYTEAQYSLNAGYWDGLKP